MRVNPIACLAENEAPGLPAVAKRASTLRALAALAGIRVDPIESDDGRRAYCVTRWNLTRQCNSIDELTEFLRQMGIEA